MDPNLNLHGHDSLLFTLSKLNVYDKAGANKSGDWYRNPEGALQGVSRGATNAYEVAKKGLSSFGQQLGGTAKSYWDNYWRAQGGDLPAAFEKQEVPEEVEKQDVDLVDASEQQVVSEETAEEASVAADAFTVSTWIGKEVKALSLDIGRCESIIENSEDPKELKALKNDLIRLNQSIMGGLTGLKNLEQTYKEARTSYKRWVDWQQGKYQNASAQLEEADQELMQDQLKISDLVRQIDGKLSSLGDGQFSNVSGAYKGGISGAYSQGKAEVLFPEDAFNGDDFPDNFPKSLEEDPGNLLVAVGEFFSNPIHEIQEDDRQIACGNDGQLSLYAYSPGESNIEADHLHNFRLMFRETYGVEVERRVFDELLSGHSVEKLTLGYIKKVIAAVPIAADAEVRKRVKGEKCLSILEDQNADFRAKEFAFTNIPDGQGNILGILQFFRNEYTEMLRLKNQKDRNEQLQTKWNDRIGKVPISQQKPLGSSKDRSSGRSSFNENIENSEYRPLRNVNMNKNEPVLGEKVEALPSGRIPQAPPPPPVGEAPSNVSQASPLVIKKKSGWKEQQKEERLAGKSFYKIDTGNFLSPKTPQFVAALKKLETNELRLILSFYCEKEGLQNEIQTALGMIDPNVVLEDINSEKVIEAIKVPYQQESEDWNVINDNWGEYWHGLSDRQGKREVVSAFVTELLLREGKIKDVAAVKAAAAQNRGNLLAELEQRTAQRKKNLEE